MNEWSPYQWLNFPTPKNERPWFASTSRILALSLLTQDWEMGKLMLRYFQTLTLRISGHLPVGQVLFKIYLLELIFYLPKNYRKGDTFNIKENQTRTRNHCEYASTLLRIHLRQCKVYWLLGASVASVAPDTLLQGFSPLGLTQKGSLLIGNKPNEPLWRLVMGIKLSTCAGASFSKKKWQGRY